MNAPLCCCHPHGPCVFAGSLTCWRCGRWEFDEDAVAVAREGNIRHGLALLMAAVERTRRALVAAGEL